MLFAAISTAKLWFGSYDPYRTIFGLGWLFEFKWAEAWAAYLIALGILAGSFFIPRMWCRFMCPLGGLLSLLSRISFLRIRRQSALCINCKKCDRTCPVGVRVSQKTHVTAN